MRNSLCLPALAAATLVCGAASATPITVGDSVSLVIDVEFWGRQQLRSANPDDPGNDIVSYGDPVQGAFRIWTDDAPAPTAASAFQDATKAVVYGRDTLRRDPPASFVTSQWLSPFPNGFDDVSPFPGANADDRVIIGDRVRFASGGPLEDWFQVSDSFREPSTPPGQPQEQLFITMSTPLDVIQGLDLDQEFDVSLPAETSDPGYGFFHTTVAGANRLFDFIVERVSVSKHLVCRP
jgi:hypothetical protein